MSDFGIETRSTGVNPDGSIRFGEDNQVYVRFYRGTKRDNFRSQEAGYPIEVGIDLVEIRQFGEKDSTIHEVSGRDKARWPRHWAAYEQGREQIGDGTPLDLLFPKNPEIVATLKANHIHHIQALAVLPDSSNFAFAGEFKKKAIAFLDGIGKGQKFHALEKRAEVAELKNLELEDRLKALEAALASSKPNAKE